VQLVNSRFFGSLRMTDGLRSIGRMVGLLGIGALAACAGRPVRTAVAPGSVRPGVTVLIEDSIHVIRNRRIGLITNQSGLDERGTSTIDVLTSDRAKAAGVTVVRLFSPEHGIRGTEDRTGIANEVDSKTGLLIASLYTNTTVAPPDSLLADLDAVIIDLQDIGTRTWTYVGVVLYAMQSTARLRKQVIVLDRPNPIAGAHADGPLLDTARANPNPPTPGRAGRAYALWPVPLRHGLTMGEMARYFDQELRLGANLKVIPVAGWNRGMWFDQTGLPWVKPSPNMPDLTSALLYPSLVAFEGSNVSVGRGTPDAFQRFGAPWLDAPRVARALEDQRLPGVRFVVDTFAPVNPPDNKYGGRRIPGIRIAVTDRDQVRSGLVGAAILWALSQAHRDSLRITAATFDDRFGSTASREALVRGEDPRAVMARLQSSVDAYQRATERIRIYR
jgi:uncharacterized protein YbbC (DUF1343 family)